MRYRPASDKRLKNTIRSRLSEGISMKQRIHSERPKAEAPGAAKLAQQYGRWFKPIPGAIEHLGEGGAFKQVSVLNYTDSVGYSDTTVSLIKS